MYEAQEKARSIEARTGTERMQKTNRKRRHQRNNDEEESEDDEIAGQGQQEGRDGVKVLSTIQKACLTFCIALLDQKHMHHDYDSAMMCALAVLCVKSIGSKSVDQYPPILYKMIQIARFMVVQQAFEKVQPPAEFGDEGYKSDGEDYGSERFPAEEVEGF